MASFFRERARLKPAGSALWNATGGDRQRGETRSTRSPVPLSVVTSRSPLRADVTERSRPNRRSACGRVTETTAPASSKRRKIISESFSTATASVPSRLPHCEPRTQVAPDVAMVGSPDDHAASCWSARERLVGHRDGLVVARDRVPAVVAAGDEPVDLVVAEAAVLHRPQGAVGPLGEALHVAVAVRPHEPACAARRRERVVGHRGARPPVDAQHLAAQRVEVARVRAHGGVAGADEERVAVAVEQQPAAAVATRRRWEAGEHDPALRQRAPACRPATGSPVRRGRPPGRRRGRPTACGTRSRRPATAGRLARHPHQPGQVRERAPLALAYDADAGPVALGDDQPAAGPLLDVPRVLEPAGDGAYLQRRGGGARRVRGVGRARGVGAGRGGEREGGGEDEGRTHERSRARR